MIVVATGPRSSGTSLLSRILDTADRYDHPRWPHPVHFPVYPPSELDLVLEFPRALFVMIARSFPATEASMVRRGFHGSLATAHREVVQADLMLIGMAARLGDRVHYLKYEHLMFNPAGEIAMIDSFLRRWGYTGKPLEQPEAFVDGNAKYGLTSAGSVV